uniref:RRM domain-containing protein n=1 Tax=Haptolina brevifila TaxID=156173 RepID=A0A7S2C8J7_9EUKA|mmetsp:Transcript_21408/g.43329  ORF Transcript_21408/g.43329 Transcript_21408/m.43329 type:complete len:263 (+) Transcript_21408:1-789(+)
MDVEAPRLRALFVGNLPDANPVELEAALNRVFGQYDVVQECEVLTDKSGISRGFAFVQLATGSKAERAKAALDGTKLLSGGPIKVRWALDAATLYVGDLAPTVTADVLREAFRQFGNVVECRVEKEPAELGGRSKLFGFIEYSKRHVAAKVQQLLSDNLFIIANSPRPVRVEFALDLGGDDNEGSPVGQFPAEPPPHFAQPGTLEYEFALKWRELALAHAAEKEQLREVHRQEREILRRDQAQMYEHETKKMRDLESIQPRR